MSDDVSRGTLDRRAELLGHAEKLLAQLEPVSVECQTCGEVLQRPAKLSAAEVATVLRERRATLAEVDALTNPDTGTVNPEDQNLADARDEFTAFRLGKADTDTPAPPTRSGKPRRKSSRNRTS